jgi:hypothetical protein
MSADLTSLDNSKLFLRLFEKLNPDEIKLYLNASQGYRFACRSVACGDVRGIKLESNEDGEAKIKCFVHAHMNNSTWYETSVVLSEDEFLGSSCVCEGGKINHLRCKHVGALLLSLMVLKNQPPQPPKYLKRPNMKRYRGMSESVRTAVDADLDWPTITKNMLIDPNERREGIASKDKFQTTPKQKKSKVKGNPSTLEGMSLTDLRLYLKALKLSHVGNKSDLVARIVSNRKAMPSNVQMRQLIDKQRQLEQQQKQQKQQQKLQQKQQQQQQQKQQQQQQQKQQQKQKQQQQQKNQKQNTKRKGEYENSSQKRRRIELAELNAETARIWEAADRRIQSQNKSTQVHRSHK